MAEYIERERIAMGVLGLTIVDPMVAQYADAVLLQIKQAPAADVVPVVRCVNCIHYGAEASAFDAWTPFCLKHKLTTFPDDFCSCGERRAVRDDESMAL